MHGAEWILLPVGNFHLKVPWSVVLVKNGVLEVWNWFLPNIGQGAADCTCPWQKYSLSNCNNDISARRLVMDSIIKADHKFYDDVFYHSLISVNVLSKVIIQMLLLSLLHTLIMPNIAESPILQAARNIYRAVETAMLWNPLLPKLFLFHCWKISIRRTPSKYFFVLSFYFWLDMMVLGSITVEQMRKYWCPYVRAFYINVTACIPEYEVKLECWWRVLINGYMHVWSNLNNMSIERTHTLLPQLMNCSVLLCN